MKKAKVTMRNWEPYVYDGEYNLSGTADVHPRLGRNVYVATTSTLVKASLEEDVLIYETRNTVYHCPLKYMMVSPYGNVVQEYREELARLDTSENALDRIIAAAAKMSLGEPEDTADEMVRKIRALQETGQQEIAQMEEQEKQRLIEIAGKYEDCVYIEVSSVHSGSKLVYHLGCCGNCESGSSHRNVSGQRIIHEICHRRRSLRIGFPVFSEGIRQCYGDLQLVR